MNSGSLGPARYVDVDGVRTRYFECGSGETLLMIHGWQFGMDANAEDFSPVFGRLARTFHVIAFDKLGQGETGDPLRDADWSMRGVIDHAKGVVDRLRLGRFDLLGHSRGALPAARIALDRADQVRRLVILNSNTLAPDDPSTPIDYYVKLVKKRPPTSPRWPGAIAKLESLTQRWVSENRDRVAADPGLGIALAPTPWWVHDVKQETLAALARRELRMPVLLLWGLNDASAPPVLGLKLAQLLGTSSQALRVYMIGECGHSPHQEYPEEFTRIVADFLTTPLRLPAGSSKASRR